MRKVWALIPVCVLMACKKEQVELMPKEPTIELISVGPGQVVEFQTAVVLRFSYKDGDGDLGRTDPDDHSLWVKDSRLNAPDGYHIIPLAPPDAEVAIQGELEVQLRPLFLLGNSTHHDHRGTGQRMNHGPLPRHIPGRRLAVVPGRQGPVAPGVQHERYHGDGVQGDPVGQ